MSKVTVKQKIYSVLMENENGFLSISDIAQTAYGDAYMRETKKHLEGLVKRNIVHAIAMLAQDGSLVLTDREECKNGKKIIAKKVIGYKIADSKDTKYVLADLQRRSERLEIAQDKRFDFEHKALETGVISSDHLLE